MRKRSLVSNRVYILLYGATYALIYIYLGVEQLLRPVRLPADLLDGAVGVLELLRQVRLLP